MSRWCRPGWVGVALCLAIGAWRVADAQAVSSVWTGIGKTVVLTTPEWTLLSALGTGTGVFIKGEDVYTFASPAANQKLPRTRTKNGVTTTRKDTYRFRNIVLTSASVEAGGLKPGTTTATLNLRFRIADGASLVSVPSLSFPLQGTFKYAALYQGASQVNPTLLTPASNLKILGTPKIKVGSTKTSLSTSSPTFQVATTGAVSIVCADGYGGTLPGSTAFKSGCNVCSPGTFGKDLVQTAACKSCKTLGSQAVQPLPGQSSCTNCTGSDQANAAATACVSSNTTTSCKVNEFLSSAGVCIKCGDGATSPGGSVTTCTCIPPANFNVTTNKCACPGGEAYDSVQGCSSSCSAGFFQNPTTKTCDPCPGGCSSCQAGSSGAITCTACKDGNDEYLAQLTTNPIYYVGAGNDWLTPTSQGTVVPYNPAYPFPDENLESIYPWATRGYWLNQATGLCEICPPGCKKCSSGVSCSECLLYANVTTENTNPTYDDVGGAYVNNGAACTPCTVSNCIKCSAAGISPITAAAPNRFQSTCQKCKAGYYIDSNGQCKQCSLGCAECGGPSTCSKCLPGYGALNVATVGECELCTGGVCGDGTCSSATDPAACTACTPTNTKAAVHGFRLDTGSKSCGRCTNAGTAGATDPVLNGFCAKCDTAVNVCDTCVDGNYLDPTDKRCLPCVGNTLIATTEWNNRACLKCTGSAKCDECNSGFYRDTSGQCVECTVGLNCRTCNDGSKCTSCHIGFYLDPTSKDCKACGAVLGTNVVTCSSASVATSCAPTSFLFNGLCEGKCGTDCNVCASTGNVAGNCAQCNDNRGPSSVSPANCIA